jgi:ABC-type phosphate transport system substrate-binding protein
MGTRATWGLWWALLASAAAVAPRLQAADAPPLAVIVHPSNAVSSLSVHEIEAIFTSSRRHWRGGKNIVAFNYAAKHALRVAFDEAVLRMDPDEVSRFWVDQRIRGRASPPRQVPSPRLMVRVVEKLPEAIGYAPMDEIKDHDVKVVAIVRGGRVVEP